MPKSNSNPFDDNLLIRQQFKESTFRPNAVSRAGARGLAQIKSDVESDAIKAGVIKQGDDIFNPEVNKKVQKWYMDNLFDSSFINKQGTDQPDSVKMAKTLAAYNWGRGNLLNYLNREKQKGVDIYKSYDWLNNLPKETHDYVNKILLKKDPKFEAEFSKAYKNYSYAYGGIPIAQPGIEHKVNKWLGEPMKKAEEAAVNTEKWYNPKTKKWEQEDPTDNLRHALAGKYTSEAIANKFPSWMKYTGIPQVAGIAGANALGIGHELSSPNRSQGYSWWDTVREAGEDLYNNAIGSLGLSEDQLRDLSYKNLLPDGYAKGNMYFKKAYGGDPSLANIEGHYPFGGQNSKTGTHFEECGWLDAYDDEYRRGGQRRKKRGTSKNIQSSINDIFQRNYDIYGPAGRNRYDPTAYKTGGWLDNVD